MNTRVGFMMNTRDKGILFLAIVIAIMGLIINVAILVAAYRTS